MVNNGDASGGGRWPHRLEPPCVPQLRVRPVRHHREHDGVDLQAEGPSKNDIGDGHIGFSLILLLGSQRALAPPPSQSVFQVSVAIYVTTNFTKSLLHDTNLLAPSVLVFASSILKYGERTWDLRGASMDCLCSSMVTKPDPDLSYVKLMEVYHSNIDADLHVRIDILREVTGSEKITEEVSSSKEGAVIDEKIIYKAYQFYDIYHSVVVDLILSFNDRIKSQSFRRLPMPEAFKMIEVELFFLYEVLHTKAAVIHTHVGRCLSLVTLGCTLVAIVLFSLTSKKEYKRRTDVAITYVLLAGAVGLEFYAIALMVVSNWTYAKLWHAGWFKTAGRGGPSFPS